jgi:hypothetical protein
MAHMTNPLATPAQLHVRSALQVLPTDLLDAVFVATQSLTQAAGLLLELPQSSTARANVVLARYWIVEPPMAGSRHHHEFSDVSAACLYIVAKMGPIPRSPRDIATVYAYLLSSSSPFMRPSPIANQPSSPPPPPDPNSYYLSEHAYHAFHTRLVALEASILTALSFDTHVALPHGLAITYLQTLSLLGPHQSSSSSSASGSPLAHRTIALLNSALLSPQLVYLTHQPNALATAAIYAAARDVGVPMPAAAWWEIFDVDREELGFLVVAMRSLDGYLDRLRADVPGFGVRGMPTVRSVKEELHRRGLGDAVPAQ